MNKQTGSQFKITFHFIHFYKESQRSHTFFLSVSRSPAHTSLNQDKFCFGLIDWFVKLDQDRATTSQSWEEWMNRTVYWILECFVIMLTTYKSNNAIMSFYSKTAVIKTCSSVLLLYFIDNSVVKAINSAIIGHTNIYILSFFLYLSNLLL